MATKQHFQVTIIGAGIAGLTSAYVLKNAGIEVVVVEKSPEFVDLRDRGLRSPPNMTRLLQSLPGSANFLKVKARKCAGFCFIDFKSGSSELVGQIEFKDILQDLGSDFYLIPHQDLHDYLLGLCVGAGVDFRYNFEVVEIHTGDNQNATVMSKSGEIIDGADGKNSVARKILLEEQSDSTIQDLNNELTSDYIAPLIPEITGATISLPVSSLKSSHELQSLVDEEHLMVWMSSGNSVAGTVYGHDLYNLDLTLGGPAGQDETDDEWLLGKSVEGFLMHMNEPRHKKIVQLASTSHWSIQKMHSLQNYGFCRSQREERNNWLKTTLSESSTNDETAAHIWTTYVSQFDYDARDAVDEWWLNWARPIEFSKYININAPNGKIPRYCQYKQSMEVQHKPHKNQRIQAAVPFIADEEEGVEVFAKSEPGEESGDQNDDE
ncbi:hypothetical protein J3R30DRAFT_3783085 [Lentinula aciculospora]|uniref:FAD-binding domain-containing protein n=1 Tax=Lentinula aciculospora TaxID=153920 RepID=A0A9W9DKD6_9AGAR|nr:hypothetical protein J3R30DRAFT_3783085 [Lentinula aciculospora]